MRIAVLDYAALGQDISMEPLARLGECRVYQSTAPNEIAQHLKDVEVAVLNKVRLQAEQLQACPSLKLICLCATGYDQVDTAYCREHGIAVCNVPGYCTDSVAQVTVAMALSLACHLPQYHAHVVSGDYSRGQSANHLEPVFHELAGCTWGLLGLGNIGSKVGEIAQAMGCRVIAYRRKAGGPFPCVDLETLCRESDVLSLHVPLSEETRGMIGKEQLALMKPTALLINAARGAVTDEAAVASAVLEGRIGGFGTDVYAQEPFAQGHPFSALLGCGNVCFTPHMAWGSYEARKRLIDEVCENIASYVGGGRRNRVES